jgi:GNAT superfamily N-acetyltransferase
MDMRYDCTGVDWKVVAETLRRVGMAYHEPDVHKRAFENSYATVFVFEGDRLIGFGRAISDGAYQAAVYDMAVVPECQKQGIGRAIMEAILQRVSQCNVILYAAIGKEDFYRKLGGRKMKTGMAFFTNPDAMTQRGFTE